MPQPPAPAARSPSWSASTAQTERIVFFFHRSAPAPAGVRIAAERSGVTDRAASRCALQSSSASPDWCYRVASRAVDDRRAAAALHSRARSGTTISNGRRASSASTTRKRLEAAISFISQHK